MKKLICCLVMLLGFALVAPAGFGSPCTDECLDTFYACMWDYPERCYAVCGHYPYPANQVCWNDCVLYYYVTCAEPYEACTLACQYLE